MSSIKEKSTELLNYAKNTLKNIPLFLEENLTQCTVIQNDEKVGKNQ